MLRIVGAFLLAAMLAVFVVPAHAQPPIYCYPGSGSVSQSSACQPNNPLSIGAAFTQIARAPDLTAGVATSSVALGATARTARACNTGSVTAYLALGDSTVTATVAGSVPVFAGSCINLDIGTNTYLAGITASSTAVIQTSLGTGVAALGGGGSGGGGGGSGGVTIGAPITGSCTNGFDLFNNGGVIGCQSTSGTGTVTIVSVATANGISGTVANPTTTPAITLTLGAITPTSVAIGAGSAITSSGPGGVLGAPAFASFGTAAGTVAQGGVISAGGPTGSATVAPIITYNAAGQLTAVSSATITPAVGSITGLGANVATALGLALNGSGAISATTSPVFVTPALGTPSSGVATNLTGTASGLTAGNVTTNANLTGPITSVGNATSIASQTGTGTTFAMSASPIFTGTVTSAAGTVASPGYTFTGATTTGFSVVGGGLELAVSNTSEVYLKTTGTFLNGGIPIGFVNGAADANVMDTAWGRDGVAYFRHGLAANGTPVAQTIGCENAAGTNIAAAATCTQLGPLSTGTGAAGTYNINMGFAGIATAATVTITNASPAVFTQTAHGYVPGQVLQFTTTGTLPTGLSLATNYFVLAAGLTANAYEASATPGGSAVNTSSAGSGTHTAMPQTTVQNAASLLAAFGPSALTGSQTTGLLALTQTRNTSGVTTALDINVIDTAVSASSLIFNARVSGISKFSVREDGFTNIAGAVAINGTQLLLASNNSFNWNSDTGLSRDSAGVIDVGTGAQGSKAGSMNMTNLIASGNIMVGSATALTLTAGAIGMSKSSTSGSGSAPGAAGLKAEVVCGTNAGTAKIIAYAGTSTSPTTIVDNIGTGVTGC